LLERGLHCRSLSDRPIGRTLDEQLKVECLFGYALCGGNQAIIERSHEFFAKKDRGRAGTKATPL
jgi:hypothetical protein